MYRAGLIFLLGSAYTTLLLFLGNMTGLSIRPLMIGVTVCLAWILSLVSLRGIAAPAVTPSQQKEAASGMALALRFGVLLLLGIILIAGLWNIVSTWDALTLYDFRAQRILETGSIAQAAEIQGEYFFSYPLYTSLAHVVMYALGCKSPMIFYTLIFIAYCTIFYSLVRERTKSPLLALSGVFLVIIAPHIFWHAQIAYTNLPYTIFLSLGSIYLIRYAETGDSRDMWLSAVLTALSTWVRAVEPFWMINMGMLGLIALWRRHIFTLIWTMGITLPITRIWPIFAARLEQKPVANTVTEVVQTVVHTATTTSLSLSGLVPIIAYFFANAVRPYLPVLVLLAYSIYMKFSTRSKNVMAELLIGVYYAAALYGTYVFSLSQPYWQAIPGSLERMMIFVSPIIIYEFISIVQSGES